MSLIKVFLYGKNSADLIPLVENFGFHVVSSKPDVIISYGGDGTLLSCEREYPGIPKLPIRDSNVCIQCPNHKTNHLLELLKDKKIKLQKHKKLEADFENNILLGLNDVVIRNLTPIHAIRFELKINNKFVNQPLIIGDGIVISTSYGSTGYYHSITKKSFKNGFSIAFSNTTSTIHPVFFTEQDRIDFKLIRGPAVLSADNNPNMPTIKAQDGIKIFVSKRYALIYQIATLRCTQCIVHKEKRLTQ